MPRKIAIALLGLSVLAHWPFGRTDFTYDDKSFIETNASIRSFAGALAALARPFPPEQPERGLYRPLTNLSHAIDYALFGDEPRGYHVVNVVLYAVLVWLVYALARVYFCRPRGDEAGGDGSAGAWLAFGSALLFSVHPVHCDAVDSVSGRSELLALIASVAALLVFLRAAERPQKGWRFACAGLYALGCASKETAALLPAVALLHLLAGEGAPAGPRAFARRYLDLALPMLGIACLYLAVRLQVLGGFGPAAPVLAGQTFVERIATMGAVYLEYARLLVFPSVLQLDFYYQVTVGLPERLGPASLAGLALALAALAAVCGASFSLLRGAASRLDDVRGLVVAGLGSALVFLLPVSHLLEIGALMAERFLFAPSLGLILFAVGGGAKLAVRLLPATSLRTPGIALLAVLAIAGMARTQARAAEWRDGIELWRSADRQMPPDYRVHSNIAAQWIARGRLEEAEAALEHALALRPDEPAALINLAVVLTRLDRLDEAIAQYDRVVELDPGAFDAWTNLGVIEMRRDNDAAAVELFERALGLNPNFQPASVGLARARERIEAARRFLLESPRNPATVEDIRFLEAYARACRLTGDRACAERFDALVRERRGP